jgi:hypothetical protein
VKRPKRHGPEEALVVQASNFIAIFGNTADGTLLGTSNVGFSTYALNTAIGPLSGDLTCPADTRRWPEH